MCNLRKSIETQKAINESVESIFQFFEDVCSYAGMFETMSNAQFELIQLMELNRWIAENNSLGIESVPTKSMEDFIFLVNETYKLLKPFANLMGQVYGNEQ